MRLEQRDTVFDILFALLVFSIPISTAIPNLILILLIPLFLLKRNKIKRINSYVKFGLAFVFFIIVKAIFTSSFIQNIDLYKHILAFGVLSILTLGIQNKLLVKKAYILGTFLAVAFSLLQTGIYYLDYHSLPFANSNQIEEVLFIHRPYYGFICLLAIVLIDDVYSNLTSKLEKKIAVIICFVLVVFVYLIVARLALFLIFSYLLFYIFRKTKTSKKKVLIKFLGLLIILITIFFLNDNFKKRLHIKNSFYKTIEVVKNQEPRFVIWACFFEAVKSHEFNEFFGYMNANSIKEALNNCYSKTIENKSKRKYYLQTEFNTHNQFFDFFLQGGILSLSLFLGMFFLAFYDSKNSFNSYFIIISLIFFLLVENLFHRQIGVYLIGVFIPLFQKKDFK